MMYNTSKVYNGGPLYDCPNYEINNYNSYQQRNIQKNKPYNDGIYNTVHPSSVSEHLSEKKPCNIFINVKGGKNLNDSRKTQYYDISDISENNYTAEKNRCQCTCNSFYKKSTTNDHRNCCKLHENSFDNDQRIRINSRNGNNAYHVSYNSNEKIKNERNKTKQIIHINSDDEEEDNNIYQCSRRSHDWNYTKEKLNMNNVGINGGNTYINITVDDRYDEPNGFYSESEDEYQNENMNQGYGNGYNREDSRISNKHLKKKRNRKIFMGKYFLSDLKETLMTPLHMCGPHPTLIVPNKNIFCYGISQKQNEMNKKPELVVRY